MTAMPKTKEEVMTSLEKMIAKMEDPKYQSRFAEFNRTLQFHFTDNEDAACYIVFEGGAAIIKEGSVENPELVITTTTDTIMGIMDGTIGPTRAFMGGKIKAKGSMNDLLRLQALMK
jgi:putative sterol carrier protein